MPCYKREIISNIDLSSRNRIYSISFKESKYSSRLKDFTKTEFVSSINFSIDLWKSKYLVIIVSINDVVRIRDIF